MALRIDVVVPAYNAGDFIVDCVGGLLAAGFTRSEITVVDDGSTDDTSNAAEALGLTPVTLERNSFASTARNAGAWKGSGDVIFFVDADVVVAPDAKGVIQGFFDRNTRCDAVFGTYDDSPAAPQRVSRIRNLLHRHIHLENAGPAVTFWSGCGAVRRSAFEAIGGFDETIEMMEDVDLGLRLSTQGRRIKLVPELQGKHLKTWTLPGVAKTDLFHRAIPWARLRARPEARDLPDTLNISAVSRISVAAVAASIAGVLALPLAPVFAAAFVPAALAVLAFANQSFIRSLLDRHGAMDAVVAVPVLWVHYFCGGLGFAWVRIAG